MYSVTTELERVEMYIKFSNKTNSPGTPQGRVPPLLS